VLEESSPRNVQRREFLRRLDRIKLYKIVMKVNK
jgi:hypothetical protein